MKEKAKGFWESFKAFFAKMEKKTRTLLGIVLAVIVVGAVAIALVLNNTPYTMLFTGLASEEASSIMTLLEENGVTDYRMQGNDTILVRKDQEMQLRAKVLMAGLPKSGFAYDTYRKGMGTMATEADRTIADRQDLQDRMAGTIRYMDGVKEAVVTITQGEDHNSILYSDKVTETKASVTVTTQNGAPLSANVAGAIRTLVSHAVKGLQIDNVSIVDSAGNNYTEQGALSGAGDTSQLKLALEEQIDNKLRTQIMLVLAPIYGEENVRVAVNSTVDVSHTVSDSTTYQTPTGAPDGEGIIGSKVWDQEIIRGTEGTVGGVVGTTTNSDINTYVEGAITPDGTESYIKNSGQTDSKVNTDKTQTERVGGTVSDVMVAVTINSTNAGSGGTANLIPHVARAAGITAVQQTEKISIYTAPFYVPGANPAVPGDNNGDSGLLIQPWMLYGAAGGVGLLVVLLILFMILRGKSRKKKASQLTALLDSRNFLEQEAQAGGADIMNIRTEKSMELRKDIRQFAEENPEIAAQMVRTWLKGGEVKDA